MTAFAGIRCCGLVPRIPGMIGVLVTAMLLVAMQSSRSQAQSNTDTGPGTSGAGGPTVVPQSQRTTQAVSRSANGGGPIVIPQVATPAG
jgi:hypothetical protein